MNQDGVCPQNDSGVKFLPTILSRAARDSPGPLGEISITGPLPTAEYSLGDMVHFMFDFNNEIVIKVEYESSF